MKKNDLWWQSGVVYQIYPRSFQDSTGDGVGDLQGIIQRLDYLHWLQVDAIWISPVYPSPMADFGYDVSDYVGIHPMFGTMEDFEQLLDAAHARSMKVILDFVPNHSSDQHPWFLQSRSSRDNPKRDWYLWADPAADGSEPNNWLAMFGGSAWEFDPHTQQYYYHGFLRQQPDLNWRNPELRQAMLQAMTFWLDKGVDGFRVDVIWHLIKDQKLRNNPVNPNYRPGMATYNQLEPVYSTDQAEVHAIIQQMRALVDSYHDRLLIGEIYLPINRLVTYYGEKLSGVHLPFNFQLLVLPWEPLAIFAAINEYEGSIPAGAWPNWVLGNHDKSRIASRIGRSQARVAALLLLTLRGTPTLYYGDELGLQDGIIPANAVQDPQEINMPGLGLGRDPARTPMQWEPGPAAGFSKGRPWLPVSEDLEHCNVQTQQADNDSFLHYVRRLLTLRRQITALSVGEFFPVHGDDKLIAYERSHGTDRLLIVLNLTTKTAPFRSEYGGSGRVLLATDAATEGQAFNGHLTLAPDQGVIIALTHQ